MHQLDDTDRDLVNLIQSDFPITPEPFQAIGDQVGLTASEVIRRLDTLKKNGFIRRIGGNFVPEKLGFVSTLCAAKVPQDKIELFADTVNEYPGVTHNYLRENEYNVWFTFIAPSMVEIQDNLLSISERTGVRDILNLPATKVFKIRAEFTLS
ncbi:MAG: Lrp/AsnC family transcriptional regulator [Desulfobacteraceae bacterium]|nr:Lrp/AsnC family transcriptional regulator [Desulfobacteraceae bacterium]